MRTSSLPLPRLWAIAFLIALSLSQASSNDHRREPEPHSWCLLQPPPGEQLQPSPPLPTDREEIDLRYGVEKRLVPTGPNPLHN
ncbi:hypothetical protein ZIOFF_003601 [Zingiber officinale]|uniref:CLAVATA3/ESR (CLE)-related protein 9 n=1 Tax=Zingiber officinale TaxID=94328 RepID=A0A8J5ITW4_ZINOF|nr:hypothetical protein ZIOFF_003601 [Zingiber officinale]